MKSDTEKTLSAYAVTAAIIVLGIGLTVISGWYLHNHLLRSIVAGAAEMKFNTALCFFLSAVVILMYHAAPVNRTISLARLLLSVVVLLVGLFTFTEYLFDTNLGIDQLFIKDEWKNNASTYPGRMPALTAINFILFGSGLLLLGNVKTAAYQYYYLFTICFVSLLALIGYFIADVPAYMQVPIHSSAGFILLCAAIWFAQPGLTAGISFERKLFTGFTAAIILIVAISLFSSYYSEQRISTTALVSHTNKVLRESGQTLSAARDIESTSRGYVITADAVYMEQFNEAKKQVAIHLGELKILTKDNARQQQRINNLSTAINEKIAFSQKSMDIREGQGIAAAGTLIAGNAGKFYMDNIRAVASQIEQEENDLLALRQQEADKSTMAFDRAFLAFLTGVFILLIAIGIAIRTNVAIRKRTETERQVNEQKLQQFNRELEEKVEQRTEQIRRSEEQFRNTLDNMLEGAQIIDFDWKYIYVNESFARHAKYPAAELVGHTVMEKYPGIEKTDVFKIYQRCFDNRETIHLENEFLFPDGSTGWFELSFQPVPEGIFILSIDITERKRAEENLQRSERTYRTIASNIPGSVICLLDADLRYVLIEGDMLERLGYSREKLLGNLAKDVLPAATFAEVEPEFKRVLQGEQVNKETIRNGVDTISRYIPLKDEENNIYAIMTVSIDITALKNAQRSIAELNQGLEEKVTQRTEQLRKTNEELEAFSYSVSHDLRAPLRAIIGFAAMLEENYAPQLDGEAMRLIAVIKDNTGRMGQLIDDLLAFSRIGRQGIAKILIDTAQLVKDIIAELEDIRHEHKISWDIQPLAESYGDINSLRQVWVNLLSNAIKYSGSRDNPQVTVGNYENNGQQVYFIRDNGVGFDIKYAGKLFKVFQRLHSAAEFEGTGIGLAIVEKVVSKHGGKVWAEAEKGVGATFYFSIPLQGN